VLVVEAIAGGAMAHQIINATKKYVFELLGIADVAVVGGSGYILDQVQSEATSAVTSQCGN
jgi:hypothetical protein